MSESRLTRVLGAFSSSRHTGSLLSRVCSATVELMAVDGAGLTVMSNGHSGALCTSGRIAEEGEALQLTLGEGPCQDAFAMGTMVEEPNLGSRQAIRWPGFSEGMMAAGVRSVVSFPIQIGDSRFGALTMYGNVSMSLTDEQVADGYVLAQVAAHLLLGAQARTPDDTLLAEMEQGFVRLAPVHQATGMVMAQLGVNVIEAFVRLRSRAFALGRSLAEVAADVVEGTLILTDDD